MKLQFRSIKTRMTAWFLVASLLPLLIVCTVIYRQRVEAIKAEAFDKLKVIRDLKVGEITFWINERGGDIQAFSKMAETMGIDTILENGIGTGGDAPTRRSLSAMLSSIRESYEDYAELSVVGVRSGKVIVSTDASRVGRDVSGSRYLTEPPSTGTVYISDIYKSRSQNRPTMEFSSPVGGADSGAEFSGGVLVARMDLDCSIYPLLLDQTGLGRTGETLIVNRDVIALNELRWHDGAALALKIAAEPALLASQGNSGVVESLDYRGVPVLAAYTHIPKTEWGFVAKMDLEEVYASIRSLYVNILVLFCVVAVGICFLALLVTRRIAQPIVSMTAVARRIQQGDLTARNRVRSEDEAGFLAEAFNQAADSVALRIEMEQKGTELAETLILPNELKAFAGAVLRKIMALTDSRLGAFYFRQTGEHLFEPLAAVGLNADLMGSFDAGIFEGVFGNSLATGKLSHIDDIPEDTVFKFKTFAGTLIPREMITLPVEAGGEIRAIICLASLGGYAGAALTMLNPATIITLNAAFANLLATEETRQLSDTLQERNQALQAQQEELAAQAEELHAQNAEIKQQRRTLEETNRLKNQFLSNMSHELRTPLNSVMALSRVLMMQATSKLTAEEVGYLEIIERNGKNLLVLINEILDLSKIEAGRMDIHPEAFSLPMTVANILESLAPIAREKHIDIHSDVPDDLPLLESDKIRVSQILLNLIGNAIKFTSAGEVTVSVRCETGRVAIRVEDTGIGIAERDLPHIFDEFRQVDGSSSRRHEGTGLGLTIARKAARLLGGDIAVASASGKGSVFTLTLPMAWEGTAPVHESMAGQRPVPMQPSQKTVLVVDDDSETVSTICRYLHQEGYNTIDATSGQEALELAAAHRPFAITLDIIMPDMDGWEVLQSLKRNPGTRDIPVIIVSVSEDRETGMALGAMGYVDKPVSKKQLANEIRKIGRPGTRTVMIADDSPVDRQEIARIVESEGWRAMPAEGGAACLALLKTETPDVLVLDLMMPDTDGFAVLEEIRKQPETRDLPVIVATAKDLTREDRSRLTGKAHSVLKKSTEASERLLAGIRRTLAVIENQGHPAGSTSPAGGPRILLVEDNESAIIQVKAALESSGFTVDVARGGQEAFDYVSHAIPDGIILDLMMPRIDGFEVLEKIRGTRTTASIPVLILTAKDLTPGDLKRLSANHVYQLVQKGDIDLDSLLHIIRSMVAGEGTQAGFETVHSEPVPPKPVQAAPESGFLPGKRSKQDKAPATILVVEDHPDNMATFKAILKGRYRVLAAEDGEAGLQTAGRERPDLILLDMALPKMDGLAVVRNLKSDAALADIPVIALTARVMKGDREKILEAGCDDYISKPIDPDAFLETINRWMNK